MNQISLTACTTEPLLNYLKSLGVFRLVAEQKDSEARGCWRSGTFELSTVLDEAGLYDFFLNEYRPTPILVPWSGSDFFSVSIGKIGATGPFNHTPTASKVIEAFLANTSPRLEDYRNTLLIALDVLQQCRIDNKSKMKDRLKSIYIARLRSCVSESVIRWIDACAVLPASKPAFNALMGSGGGSDGNTHFSDNFMQNLWEVLPDFDAQRKGGSTEGASRSTLGATIMGRACSDLVPKRTSALFDAGAVGGPNASQGFERESLGNPWSFILCLEGALLLAGSVVRRQGFGARESAAFPFLVRLSTTGRDSAVPKETSGREAWLPVWDKPTGLKEFQSLLSEGRATVRSKQATHGVDLARAAVSLGVDRGIRAFQRYVIVKGRVGGENYNTSASLGRFEVQTRPQVDLLYEVDPWLDRFRAAATKDRVPPRFRSVLQRIDSAIFDFCRHGGPMRFAEILCSLGKAEQELSKGGRFCKDKGIRPLGRLSLDWLRAANDQSVEFDLALSLSGIHDQERKVSPIRQNLEPVEGWSWASKDTGVVWTQASLATNLAAVLERRIMDGTRSGCKHLPLDFRRPASPMSISAFLQGSVDEVRVGELLWGFSLLSHARAYPKIARVSNEAPPLPRTYALLKLLFLPHPIESASEKFVVKPEPQVLALLRFRRLGEACAIALRRLRVSGLMPMPYRSGPTLNRDQDWYEPHSTVPDLDHLAAALLFPISLHDVKRLAALVLRPKAAPTSADE